MNMGVYLFLLLFALMFSGMPIALGVGMAAILTTGIWGQIGLELIFQQYYQGVNSFALLAVPLFMLAGELMTRLGLVDDIILLAKLLVGRMRGSLAQINIVASVFFSTMSGSAVADTAAIGGMLLPAMEKEGYDKEFSVAVTAASSIIGPIIPPSITMIVYGSLMSNVPTGAMFAAGIVPGVLIGLGEMALVYYFSRKRNYPRETKRYTAKEASAIAVRTLPAVLTPVVIVVAIFSGFCSATEAACIANIWVLITGALYYRRLNLKVFGESVIVAVETAGAILLLNAAAKPLSYLIAMAQLPTMISEAFTSFTSSKIVILLLINVAAVLGVLYGMYRKRPHFCPHLCTSGHLLWGRSAAVCLAFRGQCGLRHLHTPLWSHDFPGCWYCKGTAGTMYEGDYTVLCGADSRYPDDFLYSGSDTDAAAAAGPVLVYGYGGGSYLPVCIGTSMAGYSRSCKRLCTPLFYGYHGLHHFRRKKRPVPGGGSCHRSEPCFPPLSGGAGAGAGQLVRQRAAQRLRCPF